MDQKIVNFIRQQHIATICCCDEQKNPYCFNCMYAFNEPEGLLYFKSATSSRHSILLTEHPVVAGTILPDKLNLLTIKGIQFSGQVIFNHEILPVQPTKEYHKKLPFALTIPGEVFTISLISIKMTDKSRGIGKKLVWNRETSGLSKY